MELLQSPCNKCVMPCNQQTVFSNLTFVYTKLISSIPRRPKDGHSGGRGGGGILPPDVPPQGLRGCDNIVGGMITKDNSMVTSLV